MKVKIVKHCGVEYDGVLHGPDGDPFDLPDGIAETLIAGGTCEAVDEPKPELIIVTPEPIVVPPAPTYAPIFDTSEDVDEPEEDENESDDVVPEPEHVEEIVDEPKPKKRGRRKKK